MKYLKCALIIYIAFLIVSVCRKKRTENFSHAALGTAELPIEDADLAEKALLVPTPGQTITPAYDVSNEIGGTGDLELEPIPDVAEQLGEALSKHPAPAPAVSSPEQLRKARQARLTGWIDNETTPAPMVSSSVPVPASSAESVTADTVQRVQMRNDWDDTQFATKTTPAPMVSSSVPVPAASAESVTADMEARMQMRNDYDAI